MPSGPGVISDETVATIAKTTPPGVATFLLTSLQDTDAIIAQQRRVRTNTIQLCDRLSQNRYAALRAALPGIALVQVVHVTSEASVTEAVAAAPHVDAILLDSGNPDLAVKQLGGTGRVHDWRLSARIREAIAPVPLFLAGGLRASNIAQAVDIVQPFGVDVCSGVRTGGGALDAAKLGDLFGALARI